jgi:Ni,Fe-hydrogenase III component G
MNRTEEINEYLNDRLKSGENQQKKHSLSIGEDGYGNPQIRVSIDDRKDITTVASCVANFNGRCVTATAYKNDGEHAIVYHFDIDGLLFNVYLQTTDNTTDSITPIISSANWAEREIREMFGIEMAGHPSPERLFLDETIEEGILNNFIPFSKVATGLAESDIQWQNIGQKDGGENE